MTRALVGQLATGKWFVRDHRIGVAGIRVGIWAADLQAFELDAGDTYAIVLRSTPAANDPFAIAVPVLATLPDRSRFDRGWPKDFSSR